MDAIEKQACQNASNNVNTNSSNSEKSTPSGVFDLVIVLANSFGRFLPIVALFVILAACAWYFLKELSSLQTRLIESEQKVATARVNEAKALASADSAADKARNEILLEQSKRLVELNEMSSNVSKRIGEIVANQLDNITKFSHQDEVITRKLRESQEIELKKAQDQLKELEAKKNSILTESKTIAYVSLRPKLIELAKEPENQNLKELLDVFRQQLEKPEILPQIESDAQNKLYNIHLRCLLICELMRIKHNEKYLDMLNRLIRENRNAVDSQFVDIMRNSHPKSEDTQLGLLELCIDEIMTTKAYDIKTLSSYVVCIGSMYSSRIDNYFRNRDIGDNINFVARLSDILEDDECIIHCYHFWRVIVSISIEAADVVFYSAIDNINKNGAKFSCLHQIIENGPNGPRSRPKNDAFKKWINKENSN